MSPLQEALWRWRILQPDYEKSCCSQSHFCYDDFFCDYPRPDEDVCRRELAWRRYVRIRDENPHWGTKAQKQEVFPNGKAPSVASTNRALG